MHKTVILPKGYTLEVVSWENDADNYETHRVTVQTEEEVRKISKLCRELFVSCNNGDGGIGNTCDDEDEEADQTINDYIENNPELGLTKDQIIEINHNLCGESGDYLYRVFASLQIFHTSVDIVVDDVTKSFK